MKILKRIAIIVVIIIAIPLIIALFVNKDYLVEREVTINKPRQEVFDYVKQLRNQDNYSVWSKLDPNAKKDFRGTDGTVGFVYAWDGNDKMGKGEEEIKNITEGERLDLELRFLRPFESTAQAHMTTESVAEGQTKVKWGMKGRSPYPMNFMNLFMDGMLGKDLQTGLQNLKTVLEKAS